MEGKVGGQIMTFQAKCSKQDHQGNGLVLHENEWIVVPGLLEGEEAVLEIVHAKKAKIKKIVTASTHRVKAPCPYYQECGGCQLQHMDYQEQLRRKHEYVMACFSDNQLPTNDILYPIGMKDPFFYRSKAQMVITEKNKRVMAGLYEESSHKVVNVDRCIIQNEPANEIIKTLRELFEKHKIPPYNEDKQTGLIRHVMVKRSPSTEQILVVIVTSEEKFPGRNNVVSDLRIRHPEITSIVQNINPRKTSIILGDFERVLYGSGKIEDEMLGNRFLISSKTFYQVNHRQMQIMIQKALELAKPSMDDVVIDAYAGVGTIGMLFAKHVKKVIAVESNADSVSNAIQNAKRNQLRNIRFYKDDAIAFLHKQVDAKEVVDIIVFDPPRSGLDASFIEAIANLKPKKVVYISCDPSTLARDLKLFVEVGYQIMRVQPIDLFPQTFHVETVSLLSLKTP